MDRSAAEEWREIPGWGGHYSVSTCGRVRRNGRVGVDSLGRRRNYPQMVLKQSLVGSRAEYLGVTLHHGGRSEKVEVHRLVLMTFVGPRPPGFEACHNNSDKLDNRLNNLRWDTRGANTIDRMIRDHGHGDRCPRGHLFYSWNLRPDKARIGVRGCRSCKLAMDRAGADFVADADAIYQSKLATIGPTEVCVNHVLAAEMCSP